MALLRRLLCAAGLVFLISCGQQVQVAIEPLSERAQLRAELAVKKIARAHEGETSWEKNLAQIRQDSRNGIFDWSEFWKELESKKIELRESEISDVLSLHVLSCGYDSFRSFAAFLIRVYPARVRLLLPPSRKCASPLGDSLAAQALELLRPNSSIDERAQFFLSEFSKDSNGQWMAALSTLDQDEWLQFADSLVEGNDSTAFARLIRSHSQVLGQLPWLENFGRAVAVDLQKLSFTLKSLGLSAVLDALSRGVDWADLSGSQKKALFLRLGEAFEQLPAVSSLGERWELRTKNLLWMRSLQEQALGNGIEAESWQLTWLEKLERSLEEDFKLNSQAALSFLNVGSVGSLDLLWFKFRLSERSISNADLIEELSRDLPAADHLRGLSKVLYERLRLHLSVLRGEQPNLASFCELLSSRGAPNRKLTTGELEQALAQKNLGPGCVHVESAAGAEARAQTLTQSFDSVIFSQEASLRFEADQVDLGLMDFSNSHRFPKIPAVAADPSADALSFPLFLGFKILAPSGIFSREGIYYVPFHVHYRAALPAIAEDRTPQTGLAGFNLEISVKDRAGSQMPSFVSRGTSGQEFESVRLGGRPDSSNWPLLSLRTWFEDLVAGSGLSGVSSGEMPILVEQASTEKVRRLKELAERVDGKVQVYVLPQSVSAMPSEQQEKIIRAFEQARLEQGWPSLEAFLMGQVAPIALQQLNQTIEDHREDPFALVPNLDFSQERSFAGGDAGPVLKPGAAGSSGQLKVENL